MSTSSSLTSATSPSCPTSLGLLSLCASLSFNIWLANRSYLLIFCNSSLFLSSTSPDPPSFVNFSDYLATFLIFPCHLFSTMKALLKARSSLKSVSCCCPPICQRTLPLSHSMTLTLPCLTPREGVYVASLVEDIVNIRSSIKKTLIHGGISLNSLPLAYFLKTASDHEKYWCFLARNLMIYPSNVVLT
jgi:hypothetical protein